MQLHSYTTTRNIISDRIHLPPSWTPRQTCAWMGFLLSVRALYTGAVCASSVEPLCCRFCYTCCLTLLAETWKEKKKGEKRKKSHLKLIKRRTVENGGSVILFYSLAAQPFNWVIALDKRRPFASEVLAPNYHIVVPNGNIISYFTNSALMFYFILFFY